MSQMPNIKPEVNVTKEREEKKGAGLLGFLSRLTGGGAGGATGGIGGLGGAAASGGLLATKAGLIGLILAGTTVAGGLGLVGWTAFGPGQGDRADNPSLQLFASKPKEASNPFGAVAPVAKDGSSSSLNYLAQANAPKSEGGGEAAPAEATAASAATGNDDASASSNATPHLGESVATNGPAPKAGLKDVKKLGELSKGFGGGSGSAGSASAAALKGAGAGANAALSNAGSKGSLGGGFGQRGSAAQSIGRGVARARAGSATRQAMNALSQNRSAYSSQAGGRTYDGSAAAGGGAAGLDAGMPGAGTGLGNGGSQPTSTPNSAAQKNEFEAPPTPEGKNVTPYQKALNMAQMMLGAAAALLMVAYFFSKSKDADLTQTARTTVMILAALAAALSTAAIIIGAMISGGKYGQPLQGGLIALAGGLMGATAAMMMFGQGAEGQTSGKGDDKAFVLFGSDMTMFMMIAGGAGALALAGSMLSKPRQFPASEFEGKKVPDLGYHYEVRPDERSRYSVTV